MAFDDNLTDKEDYQLRNKPMVMDLAVGVKGAIDYFDFCSYQGKLVIGGWTKLTTDPSDYFPHYLIVLQADGSFEVTLVQAAKGDREVSINHSACWLEGEDKDEPLFQIKSINGHTDLKSFILSVKDIGN